MLADPGGLSEHVLGGVDGSRGGSLVAGHDLRYKARGSRAWGFLPEEGFVRSRRGGGWLGAGSILAKCARR